MIDCNIWGVLNDVETAAILVQLLTSTARFHRDVPANTSNLQSHAWDRVGDVTIDQVANDLAASGWIGWATTAVLGGFWVLREVLNARGRRALIRRTKVSTLKMQLELLNESADARVRELDAIGTALRDDRPPELGALTALEERGDPLGGFVSAHLRSRAEARSQLPSTIGRVLAIQRRRAQLEREVMLGVEAPSSEIDNLRRSLDLVSVDLSNLLTTIVESPRIFVQEDEPSEAEEGDLWLAVHNTETVSD